MNLLRVMTAWSIPSSFRAAGMRSRFFGKASPLLLQVVLRKDQILRRLGADSISNEPRNASGSTPKCRVAP